MVRVSGVGRHRRVLSAADGGTGRNQNGKGYLRREWEKMRPRNEALDTWVYARAAAFMMGVDRYSEHHWLNIEKQLGITSDPNEVKVPPVQSKPHSPDFASNEPAPVPSSDPFNRLERGGSYFGNRKGWFGR
jgi:phage terminase large subunit GpA-like protein